MDFDRARELILADLDLTLGLGLLLANWLDGDIKLDTSLVFISELMLYKGLRLVDLVGLGLDALGPVEGMVGDTFQRVSRHVVLLHHKHRLMWLLTLALEFLFKLPEAFAKEIALLTSHANVNRGESLVLFNGHHDKRLTKKLNVST